jgi:hypothetical protein
MSDTWVRLRIDAELLEDAHLGSGSGGEGVDALVARDRYGRPVIWASHLEGALREAALRLGGQDVADSFFGRRGGLRQRAVFTSLYAVSDPDTRVWRSAARNSFDNRAPKPDTLRAVEHVAKGARFEGYVEVPMSESLLLRRLLSEVDCLGRGRASGRGRVRLSTSEIPTASRVVGSATGRLLLLLRNLDPLCITATSTPGNLIPSLAFVPGRAIIGALADWLIGAGRRDAATLLVDGRVSVSDALPVPCAPKNLALAEALPAPLRLQSEKPVGPAGPIPWWAQAPVAVRRVDGNRTEVHESDLKRPEDDLFVFRASPQDPWRTLRTELRVRLRSGRPYPNQADPSLFAVEQISEDTLFLGEIAGTASLLAELATALLPVLEGRRWLRIGRGGAPVEVTQLEWSEPAVPVTRLSHALLILTSDLLVRDEYLRWSTRIDSARLRQLPVWPSDVQVTSIMQDAVEVHGFNGTSRLWRMPAFAVRRGSVFEVEGKGVAELARLMTAGRWLGERTHEGFGRFRLDDTLPGITADSPEATNALAPRSDDPDETVAATTRRWLVEHSALAEDGSALDPRPSLAQWHDLIADLERNGPGALTLRQTPTTAGGRSWSHRDAQAILHELAALSGAEAQASHARYFVRWLRAEMRGRIQ